MEIKHVDKKEFRKKAKIFFQSQRWNNILVFLVFVVLAFGFWMMQYFQQRMECEITIPINYVNVPGEIILSDSTPNQLTLKVTDKGIVFLKYYYNKKSMTIDIDLKDIPVNRNTFVVDRNYLNFEILDRLSNTTQLLSYKPENIEIHYSPLAKKELPVRINGKITPAQGYIFTDTLHIEPNTVVAYGNKESLDSLTYIHTVNIQRENIQKDLNIDLKLIQPDGVSLSTDQVNISSGIEEYTEKIFNLPVICYDIPTGTQVRFFPSTVEVTCTAALSMYSQLTEDNLEISVNYRDLQNNQGNNISLDLTQKPEWLISYRIVPETVEFLIEKN